VFHFQSYQQYHVTTFATIGTLSLICHSLIRQIRYSAKPIYSAISWYCTGTSYFTAQ